MATINHVHGMLLEEAVLYLIKVAGYNTVTYDPKDPTLYEKKNKKTPKSAGILHVRGRGEKHQIDAIADFFLNPPFSHPQRLLIEAKRYTDPVGLPIIRNVTGLLKDVSEAWVVTGLGLQQTTSRIRYHYQAAVISTSGFTKHAEAYAFAQDIYLIQLAKSRYFQNALRTLENITSSSFGIEDSSRDLPIDFASLRQTARKTLASSEDITLSTIDLSQTALQSLKAFFQACRNIKMALPATIDNKFPLFLIPNPSRVHEIATLATYEIPDIQSEVHVHRDPEGGWLLQYRGENFFSFDLPPYMFKLFYEQERVLRQGLADSETVNIQGTIVNLGERVDQNIDNGIHPIRFKMRWDDLQLLTY